MHLELQDLVFCTLDAKLKLYEVTSVVKQGKSPRYEICNTENNYKITLPMNEEDEWFGKYIFLDINDAKKDLDSRIQEEISRWSEEMFQGKEQFAQYLFQLWLDVDRLQYFTKTGEQNREVREQKIKLFADKMEEYFGVRIVTSGIPKQV